MSKAQNKTPRPTIKSTIRTVTPQLARTYLLTSRNNRKITSKRVTRLATAMRSGEWVVAQPIMFNCDGTLIDGQHRCSAVIEANVPVDFLVCEGFDRDSVFGKLDDTSPRKLSHWFECNREERPDALASVVRQAHIAERGFNPFRGGGRVHLTGPAGVAFLEEHPEIRYSVNKAPGIHNTLAPAGTCAYLHYEFARRHKRKADQFFCDLVVGDYDGEGDPIYLLSERLKANKRSTKKMRRADVAALLIKAWNIYIKNEKATPQMLRWMPDGATAEAFPKIL